MNHGSVRSDGFYFGRARCRAFLTLLARRLSCNLWLQLNTEQEETDSNCRNNKQRCPALVDRPRLPEAASTLLPTGYRTSIVHQPVEPTLQVPVIIFLHSVRNPFRPDSPGESAEPADAHDV